MNLFLTDEEIRELTGRAHRGRQIAWLRTSGIPFHVNAAGRPIVARAHFMPQAPTPSPTWSPREA